jgi:NAD(P)-dependent dehydrogenase (short-subunit alcohol dehydrogenase family)
MAVFAITGAASGICAAVAQRLKREGHQVIGIDIQPADVVADLGTSGGRAMVAERVAELSGGSLDGVVSGAGLGAYGEPDCVLRVNYFGALAVLNDLMPLLSNGTEPAAVAVSSLGAIIPDVRADQSVTECVDACLHGDEEAAVAAIAGKPGTEVYCIAKRALAFKIREYANHWGVAGIRLNAIAPGSTDTPMRSKMLEASGTGDAVREVPIPLGRPGLSEEVAGAICFLLGRDARFVHGSILHVDGGSDAILRPRHL